MGTVALRLLIAWRESGPSCRVFPCAAWQAAPRSTAPFSTRRSAGGGRLEVAHVLLQHAKDETISRSLREVEAEGVALLCCEALDLDGAEYARGYLQHWLRNDEIPEQSAQRIITTAQRILAAGCYPGAESQGMPNGAFR